LAAEERHHPHVDHSDLRRALRVAQAIAYLRELTGDLSPDQRTQLAKTVLAAGGTR
jgi:hypothetical protein